MAWITCGREHLNTIASFLEQEEPYSISCNARMQREILQNKLPYGVVCKVLPFTHTITGTSDFGTANLKLRALVYYSLTRTMYPIFSDHCIQGSVPACEPLVHDLLKIDSKPQGIIGKTSAIQLLADYLPHPRVALMYDYMVHIMSETSLQNQTHKFEVRRAIQSDFEDLVCIEAEYQREEVLTPIHEFSLSVCMAALQYALRHVPVYVAVYNGNIIARAQINGTGKHYEQIGGVYVKPEFRRMHAGSAVMQALIFDIISRGKIPCLYVKKNNKPAVELYKRLGFSCKEDFSIQYY